MNLYTMRTSCMCRLQLVEHSGFVSLCIMAFYNIPSSMRHLSSPSCGLSEGLRP
jgi:hypothetical protein